MLLSVTVCFILLYQQVIVSFFASVKTGVSIQLVAIATFFSLLETLCLISVQLHKTRLDFLFVLADSYFIFVRLMKGQYRPSST